MTSHPLINPAPPEITPAQSPPAAPCAARLYIYCITDAATPLNLEQQGGSAGLPGLETVIHDGIAAVVSTTVAEKLDITRGNALMHQRVMEAVMQRGHTVLPVRFNTIAESAAQKTAAQRIIDHVLAGRRQEILNLLTKMRPLVELGVKGLWPNMEMVFHEIVQGSPEIQVLRQKLLAPGGSRSPLNVTGQVKLGEMVKRALEAKKNALAAALLARVAPLTREFRRNKIFGDPMFANLALLVEKTRQDEITTVLSAFEIEQVGQAKLRCVGPLPPCNFLELTITWDD